MDLLCLSGGDQGGQWGGHVHRPHIELPGYLHRTGPEGRRSRRKQGSGTLGPAGSEAPYRSFPAHTRLRRAVQRRPLLGDRVCRRHGSGRAHAGDQEQLSHAAHAFKSWPGTRTEHYGSLVQPYAYNLQALLRQGQPRYVLPSVRERRPDAPVLGTITVLPAAFQRCGWASRCSSSAPA